MLDERRSTTDSNGFCGPLLLETDACSSICLLTAADGCSRFGVGVLDLAAMMLMEPDVMGSDIRSAAAGRDGAADGWRAGWRCRRGRRCCSSLDLMDFTHLFTIAGNKRLLDGSLAPVDHLFVADFLNGSDRLIGASPEGGRTVGCWGRWSTEI
ncbi:hypothetical protein ACLOJK_026899, partial [Asimina triloba]